jgi:CRISPR-associated protein Csm1
MKGDLETARFSIADATEKFRLLVGDLSGIQDYIFNIRNVGVGGTAKRLRSRSFYLTALSDIASHVLLHTFGLPLTNLVISSGGKFYLMLPNNPDASQKIAKFKKESAAWLIRHLNGEIALNIADVAFSCKELMRFNEILKSVKQALQTEKERAFSTVLTDKDGWKTEDFILADRKFENEESLCPSCRKFPGFHRKEEGIVLCDYCHDDIALGTDLAQASGVQFFNNTDNGRYKAFHGYSFSVVKDSKSFSSQSYLVQAFNNWDFNVKNVALKPRPFANHIPIFDDKICHGCENDGCREKENARSGSPKFFICLANTSTGRKTLGVLKADVDYLGLIFISGFADDEEKCISRITTLSRFLESFFTGRLQHLLQSEFPDIYTVYAGGDDMLLIGPWNKVLDAAARINSEFECFTCHNPAFSLSAGIGLMHAHFPVYAAVGEAEALLKKAKHEKIIDEENPKQQLAVFDDIVKWARLPSIQAEAKKLAQWQESKKVSMGFVRLLLNCSHSFLQYKKEERTSYLRFIPMLSYSIARNISVRDAEIMKWSQDLTDLKSTNLAHLAFIANYSIQTNRS